MEALHGAFDPSQQVPRPRNISGDGGHVASGRGQVFGPLVGFLHACQLQSVVVENHHDLWPLGEKGEGGGGG